MLTRGKRVLALLIDQRSSHGDLMKISAKEDLL
jgi:hypothetical protein